MKWSLIVTLCVILGTAGTASASVLGSGTMTGTPLAYGSDSVTLHWERDSVSIGGVSGLDEIKITIASINAAAQNVITVGGLPSPDPAAGVANFVASTGGQISLSSATGSWFGNTASYASSGLAAPQSYVNMASATAGLGEGRTPGSPVPTTFASNMDFGDAGVFTEKGYNEFHGTWADSSLTPGSLLADIFVSNGANITFTGGLGLQGGEFLSGSVSTTATAPEPSTLVLLASGLIGLAAYAWRKRK
jgi:hypothetical protein